MTEQQRWLLFFLLSFLVVWTFTLMSPQRKTAAGSGAETVATTTSTLARAPDPVPTNNPVVSPASSLVDGTSITLVSRPGRTETVQTANYRLEFDTVGAVIRSFRLRDPGSESFDKDDIMTSQGIELVRMLPNGHPDQVLPLEISFADRGAAREVFEKFNYVEWSAQVISRGEGGTAAVVQFDSPVIRGIKLRKTLTIPADEYLSELTVTIWNESGTRVTIGDSSNNAADGLALRWGPGLVERDPLAAEADAVYDTALAYVDGDVTVLRPQPDQEALKAQGKLAWGGVESKYFTALFIPQQPDNAAALQNYDFRAYVPAAHKRENVEGYQPPMVVELGTPAFDLEPGSNRSFSYKLYVGPKKFQVLGEYKRGLEAAMFPEAFFFMRPIYLGLTDFLNWLYRFVRNYGIAIILLTCIVRLLVFPLTQKQIKIQARTMAEMAKIKPHLDAINEKYKNNRAERDQHIWKVYKEHNVSPFAPLRGCLPLLLQMPIFIGLYRVCNDTIDLQGANFLWIDDLSVADHLFPFGVTLPILGYWFNLLPLIMGVTQMIATWVGLRRATNLDPAQKQMMYFMPIILTFMLYQLPAGLMVYWCTSNIWQIFQTMVTNKIMEREEAKHKEPPSGDAGGNAASEYKAQQKGKGKPILEKTGGAGSPKATT